MRRAIRRTSRAYRSKRKFRAFESFAWRRAITSSSLLRYRAAEVSGTLTERARFLPQTVGKDSARSSDEVPTRISPVGRESSKQSANGFSNLNNRRTNFQCRRRIQHKRAIKSARDSSDCGYISALGSAINNIAYIESGFPISKPRMATWWSRCRIHKGIGGTWNLL